MNNWHYSESQLKGKLQFTTWFAISGLIQYKQYHQSTLEKPHEFNQYVEYYFQSCSTYPKKSLHQTNWVEKEKYLYDLKVKVN